MLKAGAAMGFDARAIGRLTLAEFAIQFDGWCESQGVTPEVEPPTREEFDSADWSFGDG